MIKKTRKQNNINFCPFFGLYVCVFVHWPIAQFGPFRRIALVHTSINSFRRHSIIMAAVGIFFLRIPVAGRRRSRNASANRLNRMLVDGICQWHSMLAVAVFNVASEFADGWHQLFVHGISHFGIILLNMPAHMFAHNFHAIRRKVHRVVRSATKAIDTTLPQARFRSSITLRIRVIIAGVCWHLVGRHWLGVLLRIQSVDIRLLRLLWRSRFNDTHFVADEASQ